MSTVIDKWLTTRLLKPLIAWYLKRDRWYQHPQLNQAMLIKAGVFHPRFFFSSEFFAGFALRCHVKGKLVCEMGAGSGLLSFLLLQQGAMVTSVDLSQRAIEGLLYNKQHIKTATELNVIMSDVFEKVPQTRFDFIFVNPPYFFKSPQIDAQLAWYAGSDGRFFIRFFDQLKHFVKPSTEVYMVLADNCDLQAIHRLAAIHNWELKEVYSSKIRWEINSIFHVLPR